MNLLEIFRFIIQSHRSFIILDSEFTTKLRLPGKVDVLLGLLIAFGDTIPKLPRLDWTIGLSECLPFDLYMLLLRYCPFSGESSPLGCLQRFGEIERSPVIPVSWCDGLLLQQATILPHWPSRIVLPTQVVRHLTLLLELAEGAIGRCYCLFVQGWPPMKVSYHFAVEYYLRIKLVWAFQGVVLGCCRVECSS